MSDYMIPLGGGNEIGASAYFLSIGGLRVLLDCGARQSGEELYPDYERLLRELTDFSEIDLILISHGHYDHIGSFLKIAMLAPNAEIIATRDTKSLISLQLLEFGRVSRRSESERIKNERFRLAQAAMARIQEMPVMSPFVRKGCRITLLPAGHMPGAVMVYLESPEHRILYSGDFSVRSMFGLNGMRMLPEIKPDVLLLNAPNTYLTPEEWREQLACTGNKRCGAGHSVWLEREIRRNLAAGNQVYLYSRGVPKHLDLFYFLQDAFPEVPVILEPKSRVVADALADMGYAVYGNQTRTCGRVPDGGSIIVGQETARAGCVPLSFDNYSLHASPPETVRFAEQTGAKTIFLLHVRPDFRKESPAYAMKLGGADAEVTQAENGKKYEL